MVINRCSLNYKMEDVKGITESMMLHYYAATLLVFRFYFLCSSLVMYCLKRYF